MQTKYDVVILGAGISGLTAGYELAKQNKSFLILEARDRVGGRIHTVDVPSPEGNFHLEMGATWVGKRQKTIIALCEELGIELIPCHERRDVLIDGQRITEENYQWDVEWWRRMSRKLWLINHTYNKNQLRQLDEISFGDFLRQSEVSEFDLKTLSLTEGTMLGTSIDNLSAYFAVYNHFSLDFEETSGDDFFIVGGSSLLPEKLAEKAGWDNILLDTEVTEVLQDDELVQINCANGQKYFAGKVLCTLPTKPTLKIHWTPDFPNSQRSALSELSYSNAIRNHQIFDKRVWPREEIGAFTNTAASEVYNATIKQTHTSYGVLCNYLFDDYRRAFDLLSEHQQVEINFSVLGLNLADISHYKTTMKHDWINDPYSGGSYAFYKPGQWFTLRPEMIKHLGNVFFCGEHLAEDTGYMNGAIIHAKLTLKHLLS